MRVMQRPVLSRILPNYFFCKSDVKDQIWAQGSAVGMGIFADGAYGRGMVECSSPMAV
jgi:hypothetical protein